MVLFKSCPKCGTGDLHHTRDHYGSYMQCVQCGFVRDVPERPRLRVVPAPVPAVAAVAEHQLRTA
jgi:uncharacterized protein (DUF983 family)